MNGETIISLISQKPIQNELGECAYEEKMKSVFAVKKSVKQSEFFQAAANGFKPEIVLEVYSFEYDNEMYCIFEGQRFKIYRTYPINSNRIELYLTAVVGETNVTA